MERHSSVSPDGKGTLAIEVKIFGYWAPMSYWLRHERVNNFKQRKGKGLIIFLLMITKFDCKFFKQGNKSHHGNLL